jgi:hypothetical protein
MDKHSSQRAVVAWLNDHDDVQSYVGGVSGMPLVDRGDLLRTAASNAVEQLPGVDFDAVDWAGAVKEVLGL